MHLNKMNIVFSSDEYYAPVLASAICSVLLNSNSDDEFRFYILNENISEKSKKRLLELKKIKDFEISFLDMNIEEFKNFPLCRHYKLPVYFRLKIPSLIKETRALYLDSDLLVKKSLKELYSKDINNYCCAAIEDFLIRDDGYFKIKDDLGLKKYFNSGVMLWNLNKTREEKIEEKCLDFIHNHSSKISIVDQDVLNVVCQNHVLFLEEKYNFQYNDDGIKDIEKKYQSSKDEIVILHYACFKKPWTFYKKIWHITGFYYYLFHTPFRFRIFSDIINAVKLRFSKRLKLFFRYIMD